MSPLVGSSSFFLASPFFSLFFLFRLFPSTEAFITLRGERATASGLVERPEYCYNSRNRTVYATDHRKIVKIAEPCAHLVIHLPRHAFFPENSPIQLANQIRSIAIDFDVTDVDHRRLVNDKTPLENFQFSFRCVYICMHASIHITFMEKVHFSSILRPLSFFRRSMDVTFWTLAMNSRIRLSVKAQLPSNQYQYFQ